MYHTTKAYLRGTHRILPPDVTLRNLLPTIAKYGITRVANITGMDRIGIPVYAVVRPNSRSLAVAQGKGLNDEAAKISGVMESIEIWCAENISIPTIYTSAESLLVENTGVLYDGLPFRKGSFFDCSKIIRWIEGASLINSNKKYLVPYQLVHTHFVLPPEDCATYFCASSNGLASGNNELEAIIHALCEVIERDASALWHVLPPYLTAKRRVDASSIDDSECLKVLERLRAADMETIIWNITSDICIPAFRVEIFERRIDLPSYFPLPTYGEGCHPSRSVALLRALTEACQSRLNLIIGSREDIIPEDYLTYNFTKLGEAGRTVGGWREDTQKFSEIPNHNHITLEADLDIIVANLQIVGLKEAISIRLDDKSDLNLAVVRVVVPGLEGIHDHPFYVPGQRAKACSLRTFL